MGEDCQSGVLKIPRHHPQPRIGPRLDSALGLRLVDPACDIAEVDRVDRHHAEPTGEVIADLVLAAPGLTGRDTSQQRNVLVHHVPEQRVVASQTGHRTNGTVRVAAVGLQDLDEQLGGSARHRS